MPSAYEVRITMGPQTVQDLTKSGYWLYAFLAIRNSDRAARALVWRQSQQYSTQTVVKWNGRYGAYTSTTPIKAGTTVTVGFAAEMQAGQILDVEAGGVGNVQQDGPSKTGYSILNETSTPFTCGLCQFEEAAAGEPFCAFPLYGHDLQIALPTGRVLLLFATQDQAPGTIVEIAYGMSIMIDLTGAASRHVAYDINEGWSWGGWTWAWTNPPGASLTKILIDSHGAIPRLGPYPIFGRRTHDELIQVATPTLARPRAADCASR